MPEEHIEISVEGVVDPDADNAACRDLNVTLYQPYSRALPDGRPVFYQTFLRPDQERS